MIHTKRILTSLIAFVFIFSFLMATVVNAESAVNSGKKPISTQIYEFDGEKYKVELIEDSYEKRVVKVDDGKDVIFATNYKDSNRIILHQNGKKLLIWSIRKIIMCWVFLMMEVIPI